MKEKKFDVLVAGELNVDLILNRLEKFPEVGKEIIANEMLLTLGSSSAIFASNLSVLGTSVSFCGRVGKDAFADKIISDLKIKNVDTGNITQSNSADTGITVAFNFENDRAMVTYPGAMNELSKKDITDEMLQTASHLHVSSVFLQPALKPGLVNLFTRGKKFGLTTSLDPQWDPSEKWDCEWQNLLPLVDVFLPNAEEIKNITKQQSIENAIESLKKYSNVIVVKDGYNGALVYSSEKKFIQPAFLNNDVSDAIGAGDSFNAGFIHKYIQQKSLNECAVFGALCGAINTTKNGGTAAFSDLDSIRTIAYEKFNYTI